MNAQTCSLGVVTYRSTTSRDAARFGHEMGENGLTMAETEIVHADGRAVHVTNPTKVFFPDLGVTKIDLVRYYLAVAPGALVGCRDRPTMLKRHPNGVGGDFFYQKRVPRHRPEWIETVTVNFPSGRSAEFLSVRDSAHLAWAINLGCIDLNPWPVRRSDVDHPDELRVDIDPTPEASYADVRAVALLAGEVLRENGLTSFPKTSGKRGMHLYARIESRWTFTDVRRAALALAREVERRAPRLATSAWWKEQRHGVFIDYNQNARDRTVASAYSVRAVPDARVSCPLDWEEVPVAEPSDLTVLTVPSRFAARGDAGAGIDDAAGRIDSLLELADRQAAEGLNEAPWPPHFAKAPNEPRRVAPSRAARGARRRRGAN
jgi:DNA ligase D-like protein (predicted polymerase)